MSQNDDKKDNNSVDKELSELLDSALEDFSGTKNEENKTESKIETIDVRDDNMFNDELMRQANSVFETYFEGAMSSTANGIQLTKEQTEDAKKRMMEMMESTEFKDFTATITQTIQGLSENAENLQNPINDENIFNLFDQNAPIMPFVQGMMQNLLSKDVLYPSIKEISEKFPEWLEKNKDSLSTEDKERYEKQRSLMVEVCEELEKEKSDDSEDVKKGRFEKVLSLMQKMQDYGEPPAELVQGGDILPPASQSPQDCLIM